MTSHPADPAPADPPPDAHGGVSPSRRAPPLPALVVLVVCAIVAAVVWCGADSVVLLIAAFVGPWNAALAFILAVTGLVVVSRRPWPRIGARWQHGALWLAGLAALVYVAGLVPRTEPFRARMTDGQWLQGVDADVAAAWLGRCHVQRLNVWDLGPSSYGVALSDYCFGDFDRAVLCVNLDSADRVTFALELRGAPETASQTFSEDGWRTASADQRLGMARDLVESKRLLGSTLPEIESLLGPSVDQRRRLTWYRDGWGDSTTIMLPLDADDRIDHRLPSPW